MNTIGKPGFPIALANPRLEDPDATQTTYTPPTYPSSFRKGNLEKLEKLLSALLQVSSAESTTKEIPQQFLNEHC